MRVLITGGAGFIGSHLAERLLDDGHAVVVLDNLSTGTLDNLTLVRDRPDFECVIGSVRDASLVDELVQVCDLTVHLAAAVGVRVILERPSLSIHTNVNGTENVVHATSSRNKKVIIASTSEVYGKSRTMPFAEDDDLVLGSTANLRWSYACAKALDECLALAYAQEGKLAAIVVRLFNTTGPRQTGHYGMVLPSFIAQALRGAPITVYGTGSQSRCFAHVADVVESIVRLMNTPAAYGEIFNIGNDEEITIEDLALKVKEATGSSSPVHKHPYSEVYGAGFEDMARRVPDVRKLERCIGYRPRTPLDRIIADIVAAQRAALPSG
ncbi:MAG: NAD-dependent epimerase/dehydratase family protein [Casimicrobiaceae bacterium]